MLKLKPKLNPLAAAKLSALSLGPAAPVKSKSPAIPLKGFAARFGKKKLK
jgi:hypothetical protein